MKKISTRIELEVYEIEFTYDTMRGNYKKQKWEVKGLDEKGAKAALTSYLRDFNIQHEYRAYLNAKILSVSFKRTETIEV
jgi:hypothetical protein